MALQRPWKTARTRLTHASLTPREGSWPTSRSNGGSTELGSSDPLGNVQSRTFARKADAERFLRQVEADRVRADRPTGRYGHLFPELDEAIAESFDRSFHETTERRARVVVKADFGAG